ncbi:unnamed protein product [Camellia sinensis]
MPFTAMVTMECINVGLNTLFKAATVHGMSRHVFVVYAYAVAALVLLPHPFFSRRSTELPPLNSSIACKIFLLGLIGCTSQILGYTGIHYSSPTLASAISNLVPAFTFILALIFRMEKLALRSSRSQAKIIGTVVSISGAFLVTLYKGTPIVLNPSPAGMSMPIAHVEESWQMTEFYINKILVEYKNKDLNHMACSPSISSADLCTWAHTQHTAPYTHMTSHSLSLIFSHFQTYFNHFS